MILKNTPAFLQSVPNVLYELGYVPPIIKSYSKDGMVVVLHNNAYQEYHSRSWIPGWSLFVDGIQWMLYSPDHRQALQVYSHYKLAHGHVICTGLGFGAREQWIAKKKNVTKVTVLEKSQAVIDFHEEIGTKWSEKIEIIHCDANEYRGQCDFLSIDHYENNSVTDVMECVKAASKNISSDTLWFWMLERWLRVGFISDNTSNANAAPEKVFFDSDRLNICESYARLGKFLGLDQLPKLKEEGLKEFVDKYYMPEKFQKYNSTLYYISFLVEQAQGKVCHPLWRGNRRRGDDPDRSQVSVSNG